MDACSTEESTPWDPITGKLRAHSGLKLAKGTRDALSKHTGGFGERQSRSDASTRCPTGPASAATTQPGSPRRYSYDENDLTQPSPMRRTMGASASSPQFDTTRGASGSGKRAVHFQRQERQRQQESWSPRKHDSAMRQQPGRYDVEPERVRRASTSPTRNRSGSPQRQQSFSTSGQQSFSTSARALPGAMAKDPARYDVAPRGTTAAKQYEAEARHLMHMKADPRNDMLHDGSGHNADGDGQTMLGIEMYKRFTDMKTAFIKLDRDFDGKVTKMDFMEACREWNIPMSEAERVMNSTDVDNKGFLDFDEFARRFDPFLEVTEDDEELLRMYQAGIMGDEQPIKLSGVRHGTSTAQPLVDDAKEYRDENGDLRGRLARAMGRCEQLDKDLKESRAHAARLEASLDDANLRNRELQGHNMELEGRNRELRRALEDADDARRRAEERERLATGRALDDYNHLRALSRGRYRDREYDSDEEERRIRDRLRERDRDLDRADLSRTRGRMEAEDEEGVVFVYGIEGCQKTEAMYKALDKAKVPYVKRDFNSDKRFMEQLKKSENHDGEPVYAPVICCGDNVWWNQHDENNVLPFPQSVAMDLRHLLGMNKAVAEKVRTDVDIDNEMFHHFTTMQEAFLKFDDDKDGFVTEDEIRNKCLQWNIPQSEAVRIIGEADRDGKGALNFDEFARRFDSIWNRGCRGALKGLAPAPGQGATRPKTSPPKV